MLKNKNSIGFDVYCSELLLNGLVIQKLEYERYCNFSKNQPSVIAFLTSDNFSFYSLQTPDFQRQSLMWIRESWWSVQVIGYANQYANHSDFG